MFRRDVRNPASTNFQNSTNTREFLAQTRKITKRILSPPRLPFRHTGVFCCMNNIDIIADSSPKIKMQLATRQISANFLFPFGLRACIPEEKQHDQRSFFMERFLSAPVTDAQYQRDALLVGPARSTANGPQTAAPGKFPANFWFFPAAVLPDGPPGFAQIPPVSFFSLHLPRFVGVWPPFGRAKQMIFPKNTLQTSKK